MGASVAKIWECVDNGDTEGLTNSLQGVNAKDLNFEKVSGVSRYTPLMLATSKGYKRVVELLLRAGANVDFKDSEHGWTALMWASRQRHIEIVQLLVEAKATIDEQNKSGYTALMIASRDGHHEVVDALLQAKADVEIHDKDGLTALMLASQGGHYKVVNALLRASADVNTRGMIGWTALMLASDAGHCQVVETLLQAEADVNAERTDGWTALMLSSRKGLSSRDRGMASERAAAIRTRATQHSDVVLALLNAGAHVNAKASDGTTALSEAASYGHLDLVHILLKAGADVDATNSRSTGKAPLTWACEHGYMHIVMMLLEAKAAVDIDSGSALRAACHAGHSVIVHLLLEAGADVNARDEHYRTALHAASQNGKAEIVQGLLEAGADPSLKCRKSTTAASIAKTTDIQNLITTYVPLPSALRRLAVECNSLIALLRKREMDSQLASMFGLNEGRIETIEQLNARLHSLMTAGTDFRAIAATGKALKMTQPIADRHAALAQEVTDKCQVLASAQDYDAVTVFGAKLKALKACPIYVVAPVATARPPNIPVIPALEECDTIQTIIAQFPLAIPYSKAVAQVHACQREVDGLLAAGADYEAVGRAGKALKAAIAAVKEQLLPEEDYLTLVDRHAALVQRVTARCQELASAEEYDALDSLAAKLEELKALEAFGHRLSEPAGPNLLPRTAAPTAPSTEPTETGNELGWAIEERVEGTEEVAVRNPALDNPMLPLSPLIIAEGIEVEAEEWTGNPVTPSSLSTTSGATEVTVTHKQADDSVRLASSSATDGVMEMLSEGWTNDPVRPPSPSTTDGAIEVVSDVVIDNPVQSSSPHATAGAIEVMVPHEQANDPVRPPSPSTTDGGIEVVSAEEWANDPVYVPSPAGTTDAI